MDREEIKLKQCPFCGGDEIYPFIESYAGGGVAYVQCNDCHGSVSSVLGEKEAIELWNTRQQLTLAKLEAQIETYDEIKGLVKELPNYRNEVIEADCISLLDFYHYTNEIITTAKAKKKELKG